MSIITLERTSKFQCEVVLYFHVAFQLIIWQHKKYQFQLRSLELLQGCFDSHLINSGNIVGQAAHTNQ
jgi:hypothetical protein